jgi:hypothetical protein
MYYLVTAQDWVTVFTHLANYSNLIWALAQIFAAAMVFATPVAWAMIENDYGWGSVPQPEENHNASMASYEEADTIQDDPYEGYVEEEDVWAGYSPDQDDGFYKESQIRAWLFSRVSGEGEWLWDYLDPHGVEAKEIRSTMMSLPRESWEDYIQSLTVMYAA